jgi:hypothetical protein
LKFSGVIDWDLFPLERKTTLFVKRSPTTNLGGSDNEDVLAPNSFLD